MAKAVYSNVYEDSSIFSPVSTIVYSYKRDNKMIQSKLKDIEKDLDKKDYELLDADRLYLKNGKR